MAERILSVGTKRLSCAGMEEEVSIFIVQLLLILGLTPALFPRWRDTLIWTGIYIGLVGVAFIWALLELSEMTSGEGHAFFGIFIYLGIIQILVGTSYIGKIIAISLARKMSLSAKKKFLKKILNVFMYIGVMTLLAYVFEIWDVCTLLGIVAVFISPFLWISLAVWFMRNTIEIY